MIKSRYKAILLMLSMSVVIGTASVSFVGAASLNITVFDNFYSNMDHPAETTIIIPCFQSIESARMVITAYHDPDDTYLRAVYFALDGIGDYIGVWRQGPGQVRGEVTTNAGDLKEWEFDMSHCMFANPTEPTGPEFGFYYRNFIPQNIGETIGYFSPGEHSVLAFLTTRDETSGATQDSWITITLYFEYTPCVEGSLFSDAFEILPLAVLAGTLVVIRKRK